MLFISKKKRVRVLKLLLFEDWVISFKTKVVMLLNKDIKQDHFVWTHEWFFLRIDLAYNAFLV